MSGRVLACTNLLRSTCETLQDTFYTVLLTLISAPILSALKFSGILIESFLAANLLAAIMPISV